MPASFDGSTLVVEVNDRRWEKAVGDVEAALLEKLQHATAGEIKAIRIVRNQSTAPES